MNKEQKEIYFTEYNRYPSKPLSLLKDLYERSVEKELDFSKGAYMNISMRTNHKSADKEYQAQLEWLFLQGYLNYKYGNGSIEEKDPIIAVVVLTPQGMEKASQL